MDCLDLHTDLYFCSVVRKFILSASVSQGICSKAVWSCWVFNLDERWQYNLLALEFMPMVCSLYSTNNLKLFLEVIEHLVSISDEYKLVSIDWCYLKLAIAWFMISLILNSSHFWSSNACFENTIWGKELRARYEVRKLASKNLRHLHEAVDLLLAEHALSNLCCELKEADITHSKIQVTKLIKLNCVICRLYLVYSSIIRPSF